MRTRWDAIRQGERLAELERARLRLGEDPLTNLAELLEAQGVRFIEMSLSETISGLFLSDARYGPSIIVNEDHSPRRRLFSWISSRSSRACDFHTVNHVRAKIRHDDQRIRLDAAIGRGVMTEIEITDPGEIRLYDEFRRFLGDGESASLAVAVSRRWVIAADEKGRFRRELRALLRENRFEMDPMPFDELLKEE